MDLDLEIMCTISARSLHVLNIIVLQGDVMKAETRALWEQLFEDFSQFDDMRESKATMGANAPDFKHKESGNGLW